ncbi:hypothetical protein SKAU_G00134390 [Synaphobranchus kaupii]|uniref:Integrase catalytic domain-containing protein n=1 Tax=Synaphobranchus kaupii TaxID=118154 RepID=A0A9Q1J3N0_SYNKA|nr:hypothetical protein SKAU_G00134390 [Synaphobranchus kaupii]
MQVRSSSTVHHDLSSPNIDPGQRDSRAKHGYQHSPNINTATDWSNGQGGHSNPSATADLAKFLARSQLITTGLTKFDDKVENYWAWKSSFSNAIEGLDLTAAEELDLLVKWLGKESSEYARRIKSVHIKHPAAGLKMTWERLEQCYGTPKAIEKALFTRLENFPKIANRDPQKLRDLSDLLLEIEAAKQDNVLPGLSYLDTARGIHPIEKLPYNLQDKWTSHGSRFKEQYRVPFPPFAVFSKFIHDVAKARNDHSFILPSSSNTLSRRERPDEGYGYMKHRVSVHSTQVSPPGQEDKSAKPTADLLMNCPIHKKPHPLNRCRGFREKPLEEQRQYIKENAICFHCCASMTHIAKNCRTAVTCSECGSDRHIAALHPGPASWNLMPPPPNAEHGGEEDGIKEEITSRCTEVCGEGMSSRACSKICLVNVYPNGHRKVTKKMYAILDEQSNRSLARPEFFHIFDDNSVPSPNTLKTCAGITETAGRRACGYMIESIEQKINLPLPTLVECDEIPDNRKPGKIHIVFDSSARYDGVSLNDVLLTGPDLNNSLLGILVRFRKELVAVTGDIEHMFHCFVVKKEHRDYLRFLWFRNNDMSSDIVDYCIKVHVFGNTPSPAVTIYGLRRAAREEEDSYGSYVRRFVEEDFYVDDALKSFATEEEAIRVLQQAQERLALSNLRLHKIASNRTAVINAFPVDDLARDVQDLDLSKDEIPLQRSLGICWNLVSDTFTFRVQDDDKPFTRRGVLSVVNSLFDPLGFVAPVTIQGKSLLRQLASQVGEWDSPLPHDKKAEWMKWRESLLHLQELQIPRRYASFSPSSAKSKELCVFADASVKAISAVAYFKITNQDNQCDVGFVFGKSKLAPVRETTIPRLELCAAVLAVEIAEFVVSEMHLKIDSVTFFTDSRIVLGYIYNETRRFYVYVSNRIQRIRQSTSPDQWKYVPSEQNPADFGSRSVPAALLANTTWLSGPPFLSKPLTLSSAPEVSFDLVEPASDAEIRPVVSVHITQASKGQLGVKRFERFSVLNYLIRAVARLSHIAHSFAHSTEEKSCKGWHLCKKGSTVEEQEKARRLVIKSVQREAYSEEMKCISEKRNLPTHSSIRKLNPIMDSDGLLRVGGRISQSQLVLSEINPLIIPGCHYLATLIIRHHHEMVKHQGRHFTEGAILADGLWLVGGKRYIQSTIFKCVTCRKLQGKIGQQQMSDLPAERLSTAPPFTYVGLDIFGPWEVSARRTRGGHTNSKRWAVLFTCTCVRAVHIEVVESLSTSSFINALRRFFSLRGASKQISSDQGTNFVGACKELKMDEPNTDLNKYLQEQRCSWVFNPPHSSHMGGAWERLIGVARRIMDSMFLQMKSPQLTHKVLITLMAEVCAIINARPLIPVSSDPESPLILTPTMLLTQKTGTPFSPPCEFRKTELLKQQWKQVQSLADTFWERWRREYLTTLQVRSRWQDRRPNLKEGDVVLMKDLQVRRNEWPMAVLIKTFPSTDQLTRKVEVRVIRQGTPKVFSRPITELILLLSPADSNVVV